MRLLAFKLETICSGQFIYQSMRLWNVGGKHMTQRKLTQLHKDMQSPFRQQWGLGLNPSHCSIVMLLLSSKINQEIIMQTKLDLKVSC